MFVQDRDVGKKQRPTTPALNFDEHCFNDWLCDSKLDSSHV